MKKNIFLLIFILGFSLTAIAQLGNYENREGIANVKKQSFKAPVIRIGTLSDSSFEPPVIIEPAIPDTHAIYILNIEVDSTYILTNMDSVNSFTSVDTIQKIGTTLYNLGLDKNIDESYDNWEAIQIYEANSVSDFDLKSEKDLMLPDTQLLYVLSEKVDSVIFLKELTNPGPTILYDSISIDTFYQVGSEILQDDLTSSIEEKDWKIIKDELFKDSVIDINLDDLSYEEYLDSELNKKQNTLSNESNSMFQPINLHEESEPSTTDSSNYIQSGQSQKVDENHLAPVAIERPKTPSDEFIELQKKIEKLEEQANQKNDPEFVKLKQQLLLHELQNIEEQKRNDENENLRAEFELLQKRINSSQELENTPEQNIQSQDIEDLNQLKKEVTSINQNTELIKQLLLQQQIIESLKNQNQIKIQPEPKDTSNIEIATLKQEIAELKSNMVLVKKTTPSTIEIPVGNNAQELDTLKQQIKSLQKELLALKELKLSKPNPDTIVKTTEVKPISVTEIIRGREKQIVFFKTGSYKLSGEASAKVASVVQLMLQYEQLKVVLEAHTDPSGDTAKNLLLSKKRAESVKESILQFGISASRVTLDFRGEDAQSDPAFGRRVELILKPD